MDVNATLALIRAAVHEVHKLAGGIDDDPLAELAEVLATHVESLDEHMVRGGFVPDEWLSTRLAMLQAEYRRGFEAAMLRNRAARTPLRVPDPLGPPDPANYDGRDPV